MTGRPYGKLLACLYGRNLVRTCDINSSKRDLRLACDINASEAFRRMWKRMLGMNQCAVYHGAPFSQPNELIGRHLSASLTQQISNIEPHPHMVQGILPDSALTLSLLLKNGCSRGTVNAYRNPSMSCSYERTIAADRGGHG
jgi:hypothetical protein